MSSGNSREQMLLQLDADTAAQRLARLKALAKQINSLGNSPEITEEVNNHVHTRYSFSPYFPVQAAFMAWTAGLQAVGIMDHDSVGGAEEMIEACRVLQIASTVGCELRVNADGTRLEGRRINNPDSIGILYMAIHGIPRRFIAQTADFVKPIQQARMERNRRQVSALNEILDRSGMQKLDFEKDVLPLSLADEGGTLTERHILAALAGQLIACWGRGERLITGIENWLEFKIPARLIPFLNGPDNPHLLYDVLGIMKSTLLPVFFIQPGKSECISVREAVDFARQVHAIPAYAYLGDIAESPTGDKKAEKYEDSYLDLLFSELSDLGFLAVTYMPPRNTRKQLKRVSDFCKTYQMMEISGVDINSSRQTFHCPEILEKEFRPLIDATWALIAHEKLSDKKLQNDMFSKDNPYSSLTLEEKIAVYRDFGMALDRDTLSLPEG